ncbi:MAG: hypothetical protein LBQ03_00380, partial [Puniceicoccales bacterium]|nr:hypothetical protein [Puniceicoccales bacterium]
MSEIKINTGDINGVTKTAQKESVQVRTKELPDVRDVNSFQSLLSERVESDQKRDAKRDSKNNETNLKESGENVSVFTLLLGEKIVDNGVTVVSKEEKTVSEEKFFDPVSFVGANRRETEKSEKGGLDEPVGEKVLEHFERKLDGKIFSQTRIGENEIRERLFPAPENDLAKATAVKVEHKSNEKIEGVQLLENESKEEKIVSEEKFFDSVSSVGVGGETEKNEKGILDVPVGEKVLEHFERKLDDKIFPQTQIEEDGVRKKLSPKIENDLAK